MNIVSKIIVGTFIGLFTGMGSTSLTGTAFLAALLAVSVTLLARQAKEVAGVYRAECRRYQVATPWNLEHDRI